MKDPRHPAIEADAPVSGTEAPLSAFRTWLANAARVREASGLVRRLRPVSDDGLLDLAGNDYLGLRRHPAVVAGAVAAARTHGGGAGASRLVTGTTALHGELERDLADFTGAPSALVLSTGYHANLSALTALTDADTLIVSDAHVHASLIDGGRLSRGPVAVARHNDLDHVEDLLRTRSQPRAVVVVESIYSVLGDAAPLRALAALCADHEAVLLIDEAHGLGVAGNRGQGLGSASGLSGLEHVVLTLTLSKSLAAQGGAVLGHPAVIDQIVNTARPFIYDTGLAPAATGAALAALRVLRNDPGLAGRVRSNAGLLALACGVEQPAGAVLSVPMPAPDEALEAVALAERHGIRIGCFRPPSTPDGLSRLRLTAHADHSPEDLKRATTILQELTADV